MIAKFEPCVEEKYEICLDGTLAKLVPKSCGGIDGSGDPSVMSEMIMGVAAGFANSFLPHPLDLSVRDQLEQIPLSDLTSLLNTNTDENEEQQSKEIIQKGRVFWTEEDTKLLESIFQEELTQSIANKRRVPKKLVLAKSDDLGPLTQKYNMDSIYEKLYSMARPYFKPNMKVVK